MPRPSSVDHPNARLTIDAAEKKIRELEQDLWFARYSIVNLAPSEFEPELSSYYHYSADERLDWLDVIAQAILERVEPIEENAIIGQRAICPLCRSSSSTPYADGFAYPEGLRRHLVGHGNTRQCVVTQAAVALARDHWRKKLTAPMVRAHSPAPAPAPNDIARRRETEILYRLGPDRSPLLLDEGLPFLGTPRPAGDEPKSVKWAEQRLFALAFKIDVAGRERSYTRRLQLDEGDMIVYADPRISGHILFRLYPAPSAGRPNRMRSTLGSFKIRDEWIHDLPAKILSGARSVISTRQLRT